jgi:hypothetical protein
MDFDPIGDAKRKLEEARKKLMQTTGQNIDVVGAIKKGVGVGSGPINPNAPSPSPMPPPPPSSGASFPVSKGPVIPEAGAMPSGSKFTADQLRAIREGDIKAGVETSKLYIPEGSLGRFNATETPEAYAAQQAQKSLFTKGLGAPVFQAQREAAMRGLNRNTQAQGQQLQQAQARGGIGGALGASQLANQQRSQGIDRNAAEQDLLLKDAAFKTAALGDWSQSAGKTDFFNIGQANKEKMGQLGTGLASAQMGLAERTGLNQADLGKSMAQALAQQGGSGGKK